MRKKKLNDYATWRKIGNPIASKAQSYKHQPGFDVDKFHTLALNRFFFALPEPRFIRDWATQ